MKNILGLSAAFLLVLCGVAAAQTSDAGTTPSPLDGDRSAVASIVMSAVSEVKLCELAVEKSQNGDVRSLCRSASAESARAAIQGMQLAQTLRVTGVTLQESPDTVEALHSLAQYSGREFDRNFLLAQIEDDENDEHSIRYDVEVATDASVKHYENAQLPNVRKRLELAEGALRRVSEAAP